MIRPELKAVYYIMLGAYPSENDFDEHYRIIEKLDREVRLQKGRPAKEEDIVRKLAWRLRQEKN